MSLARAIDSAGDREALRLWLRLYRPVSVIERELRLRFQKSFGVSLSRFDAMAALDRAEDGLLMGELSQRLLVTNGNVTGLIGRLVDDGLATRTTEASDRRSARVALTPAGRKAFADMATAHAEWTDEILGGLPPELTDNLTAELEALMGALRLNHNGDRT